MAQKKTCFSFMIGDEGVVISHIIGDSVAKRIFVSSSDNDSMASISNLIAEHPKASTLVILDNIDQSYQTQSFPPVAKLSVQKLVNTKLKRDFSPSDITGSLPLGKDKDGRQDWKFLIISIAPSPQLMHWLDFILELENPFQGIFLAPVEAENFIKKLYGKDKKGETSAIWKMLVMHTKVGGFRQVITKNGRLTFTRLTQPSASENTPTVIAGNIEQEISSTAEYLKRLSYREDEGIDITVISSEEITKQIDASKIGKHNVSNFITPSQAAELVSLPAENFSNDQFTDILFSSFINVNAKKVLTLHTEASGTINKVQKNTLYVKYLGLLISILTIIGILYSAYSWYISLTEEEDINNLILQHEQQLEEINKRPKLEIENADSIEDIISIHKDFSKQGDVPLDFIKTLIKSITPNEILVNNIIWKTNNKLISENTSVQEAKIEASVDVRFINKANSPEQRIFKINNILDSIRKNFSEYTINISSIPGTLNEYGTITVDFTNPESKTLNNRNIELTLDFVKISKGTQ